MYKWSWGPPPHNWMLSRVRETQHNAPPPPYRAVLSRSARSPAGRALSPSPANEFTPQPSLKMTAGRMAMGRLLVKLSTRANLIRHGIAHLPLAPSSHRHTLFCVLGFTSWHFVFLFLHWSLLDDVHLLSSLEIIFHRLLDCCFKASRRTIGAVLPELS